MKFFQEILKTIADGGSPQATEKEQTMQRECLISSKINLNKRKQKIQTNRIDSQNRTHKSEHIENELNFKLLIFSF